LHAVNVLLKQPDTDINALDNSGWYKQREDIRIQTYLLFKSIRTPLISAVVSAHLEICYLLLKSGANVNIRVGDLNTFLHLLACVDPSSPSYSSHNGIGTLLAPVKSNSPYHQHFLSLY